VTTTWSFGLGFMLTTAIAAMVVAYLRRPLERLLAELCGNRERAAFWTAFSAISVGLVPLIFALSCEPADTKVPTLLQIADQLKWGLVGMVASVLVLGWTVGRFIPRVTSKQ
jgi:hypothetical protein